MDFEELMRTISDMEKGAEMAKTIKDRLHEVNSEAKTLRQRAKKAETDLKDLQDKKNPVLDGLEKAGFTFTDDKSFDSDLSSFLASLKDNKNTETNSEIVKLTKQLTVMQTAMDKQEEEKKTLLKNTNISKIENSLLPSFTDGILNGEMVLNLLVNSDKNPFVINEQKKVGFRLEDGEIITGTDNIVNEYKKLYPKQVKNKMNSGGDSEIPKGPANIPNQFTDVSQIKALSVDQIADLELNHPKQYAQMMDVVTKQG